MTTMTADQEVAEQPVYFDQLLLNMPEIALREQSHSLLRKNIHNCRLCPFSDNTKSLPLNNFGAPIMIVGKTPSDVMGESPEGMKLLRLIQTAGIDLKHIYLTSASKCGSGDRSACSSFLISEILSSQPSVVVCMGYDAALSLMAQPALNQYVPITNSIYAVPVYAIDDTPDAQESILSQFAYIKSTLFPSM